MKGNIIFNISHVKHFIYFNTAHLVRIELLNNDKLDIKDPTGYVWNGIQSFLDNKDKIYLDLNYYEEQSQEIYKDHKVQFDKMAEK